MKRTVSTSALVCLFFSFDFRNLFTKFLAAAEVVNDSALSTWSCSRLP